MNKDNKKKLIPPIIFCVIAYIYDLVFLFRYGRGIIDSDLAAEMVLAKLKMPFPHILINPDWFYSTELRVVNMIGFYKIGLLFSPNNWDTARNIGMAIALLLLVLVMWSIARDLDFEYEGLWAAGLSLLPVGFWYMIQSIYGGYYLAHALVSLGALWGIIKMCTSKKKPMIIIGAAVMGLLAFLSGMQGIRHSMVMFAPLLVAAIIVKKKNLKFYNYSLIAFLLNAMGLFINIAVLGNFYSFQAQEQVTWAEGNGSLLTSFRWYVEGFGFSQSYKYGYFNEPQDVKLLSFNGIAIGLGLVMCAVVIASMVILIVKFKKLSDWEQILVVLTFSMIAIMCVVYSYIYGMSSYWQQTMPFGYFLIVLAIRHFDFKEAKHELACYFAIGAAVLICSTGTCSSYIADPFVAEPGLARVSDFILNETDYREGYSIFWLSNTLMYMSDGQIDVYTAVGSPDDLTLNKWLQRTDHFGNEPQSHFFVLTYSSEEEKNSPNLASLGADLIYDDGRYCVFAVE